MQVHLVSQIHIAASSAEVFEYITDLQYHHLWNPQVISISARHKLKQGSVYTTESRVIGLMVTATNRVTTYIAPRELTIENTVGNVLFRARFKLSGNGRETTVWLYTDLSTKVLLREITLPVLKQLATRELQADLKALKIAVENHLR